MEKRRYLVIISGVVLLVVLTTNATANVIVMWNGTQETIPTGWTCISCNVGADPFTFLTISGSETLYPRISNTVCLSDGEIACGGSNRHSHTYTLATSPPSATVTRRLGSANGFNVAGNTHTHNSLNVSTTLFNDSQPLSYMLMFIRANDDNEDTVPSGAIILYNGTSAPSGFIMYTTANGYYLLSASNSTVNNITGQATHNHTNHSLRTGNPTGNGVSVVGASSTSSSVHNHTLGVIGWYNDSALHYPPFVDIPLVYATTDTTFPVGMIVMTNDSTRTGNYSKLNDSNFIGKYIRANTTSFNTTGGYQSHNHSAITNITTGASSLGTNRDTTAPTSTYAQTSHTHQANLSTQNSTNEPSYANITLFLVNGSVVTTPANTCTYSGSGNWNVNCADNCNITTTVNLLGNQLNLTGTAGELFYIVGRIFNWSDVKVKSCEVVVSQGGSLG